MACAACRPPIICFALAITTYARWRAALAPGPAKSILLCRVIRGYPGSQTPVWDPPFAKLRFADLRSLQPPNGVSRTCVPKQEFGNEDQNLRDRQTSPRFQPSPIASQATLKEAFSEECPTDSVDRFKARFLSAWPGIRPLNADHWRVRFTMNAPLDHQWSERNDRCGCMGCFTIRLVEDAKDCCCPKCGERYVGRSGLRLFGEDHERPMCRNCGKKLAPTMVALLDLAQTAVRVG